MKVVSKVLFLFSVLFSLQSSGQVIVDHLTTEMAENPLVVNQKTPKLGWQLVSKNNNVSQKYYQILVASSEAIIQNNEGDVWNSGKVKSAKSQQVYYAGKSLKEGTKYFWKVKIWDQNEVVSTWSKSAFFRIASNLDWGYFKVR
jgi:alpha-L-rhamnosidase